MNKTLKFLFLILLPLSITDCTEDDNCPDILEVDINDPESIKRAEECGLSPANPIGKSLWIYKIQ